MLGRTRPTDAPGPNGLPGLLFKQYEAIWSTILTPIYNACFVSSTVPKSWRGSILCPIFKKGDRSNATNYRLIALLDVEAKCYAQILLSHLERWVQDNNILPYYQTGFRAGNSTQDNIVALAYIKQSKQIRYPSTAAWWTIQQPSTLLTGQYCGGNCTPGEFRILY